MAAKTEQEEAYFFQSLDHSSTTGKSTNWRGGWNLAASTATTILNVRGVGKSGLTKG